MGQVASLISDWSGDGGDRHSLYTRKKGLVLRWVNEAQLRFVNKSEILQDVWNPTIDDLGYVPLPDDFLSEIKDRVKWSETVRLIDVKFADAKMAQFSSTCAYSIYGGNFYVWKPTAGNPEIYYVKKPSVISEGSLANADFDVPTEYHQDLIPFLDASYARMEGKLDEYYQLLGVFDKKASDAAIESSERQEPHPVTRSNLL